MNRILTHTLCYNTLSEIAKSMRSLYEKNDKKVWDYEHHMIDLGFPLVIGDVIPQDIPHQQRSNSKSLMALAGFYGHHYLKFRNIGVSQNWTNVLHQLEVDNTDVVIGVEPDEEVQSVGWVEAMSRVLRSDQKIALCSLMMTDVAPGFLDRFKSTITESVIDGVRVYIVNGILSWALIGMSGEFLSKINNIIPVPQAAKKYGYIETSLYPLIPQHGYRWAILPDYLVTHTNNVPLYRQWKDQIIFRIAEHGQMSFEKYLEMRRDGKIK